MKGRRANQQCGAANARVGSGTMLALVATGNGDNPVELREVAEHVVDHGSLPESGLTEQSAEATELAEEI